jgi:hypothetical protein
MAINFGELLTPMLNAAKEVVGEKWPEVQDYAESEFKKIGENILMIGKMKLNQPPISDEQARLLFDIQKNASRAVLLAVEGMSLIIAEKAINAALDVIRTAVNTALKFPLL